MGNAAIITTREVLVEFLNYVSGYGPDVRSLAAIWVEEMVDTNDVEIVFIEPQEMQTAIALYRNRLDIKYILTDCISFVAMKNLGITGALTHDRHCEQEGISALLRPTA